MDDETLIRMANQIAVFYAPYTEAEAIEGVSVHLKKFWEPRMLDGLFAAYRNSPSQLTPAVAAAIAQLLADSKN
jgi:formate dehydrogenase subunit delta